MFTWSFVEFKVTRPFSVEHRMNQTSCGESFGTKFLLFLEQKSCVYKRGKKFVIFFFG